MTALDTVDHAVWMRRAYREAERARDQGEVPIGSVVVVDCQVVGVGSNQPIRSGDPTAHAEIVALRHAAGLLGNYRLPGATVYVTVEPCLMCAGALVHARVERLVYGALEPRTGAVRSVMRALDHPSLNHHVDVVGGVLADQCRQLMQQFFKERREGAGVSATTVD